MEKEFKRVVYKGQGWSLVRQTRSKNLAVIAYEKGKERLYESVGTANPIEAKRIGREKYRSWRMTNFEPPTDGSVRLLLSDYWGILDKLRESEVAAGDLNKMTLLRGRNAWERGEFFWGNKVPSEITQDNWTLFKALMMERHGKCSMKPEFKYIVRLGTYLYETGVLNRAPLLDLGKGHKGNINKRRKLEDSELKALIEAAQTYPKQTQLFIGNGLRHGMRFSEVLFLEQKNFYKRDGVYYLKIEKSKTGPRVIKVSEALVETFLSCKSEIAGPYFFSMLSESERVAAPQVWDGKWDQVRKKALVDAVFHELRHTAISNAIAKGVNPGKVSRFFGVSLNEIDRTYLKLSEKDTAECADVLGF